jgi:hypothetical protein
MTLDLAPDGCDANAVKIQCLSAHEEKTSVSGPTDRVKAPWRKGKYDFSGNRIRRNLLKKYEGTQLDFPAGSS